MHDNRHEFAAKVIKKQSSRSWLLSGGGSGSATGHYKGKHILDGPVPAGGFLGSFSTNGSLGG
jgi:hypothetical protein